MIQTAHFRAAMAALRDAGVDRLIVSPGSRSTPIVAAALACGIDCRAVIDERSAAHVALGRARVSGRPTAVVCTSGSAAACYLPAVVEAAHARIPLVVITADRPPELHGCEAPQTIEQRGIYGNRVRLELDLGTADIATLAQTRRQVARAVFASQHPEPGPVHINAPARKPLEPQEPVGAVADALAAALAAPLPRPLTPRAMVADEVIDQLASACQRAERGVITLGPQPLHSDLAEAVDQLAGATGFAVLAEATSQVRLRAHPPRHLIGSFDLIYQQADAPAPDLVVQLGAPPVSAAWSAHLASARPRRLVIAEHGWPDPIGGAEQVVVGDVADAVCRLAARVPEPGPASWRKLLGRTDDRAWRLIAGEADRSSAPMNELAAVRAAAGALPAGGLLAVGNSLPVRTLDLAVAPGALTAGVLHQRGASGIDGVLSGAVGAATATDRPILLLIGDVSFTHDLGALAAARELTAPLCAVVIDNRGGRIFERLPVAGTPALAERFADLWMTPPPCDLLAAAAAYGMATADCSLPDELSAAVAAALTRPGCTVVRAEVSPGSAEGARTRLASQLEAG